MGRDSRVPTSGSAVSSCSHSPYLLFSLQRCASAARSKTLSRKLGPGWNHGGTHDAQTSLRGLDAKLHELSRVKLSDTNNNHYQKQNQKKVKIKKFVDAGSWLGCCPAALLSVPERLSARSSSRLELFLTIHPLREVRGGVRACRPNSMRQRLSSFFLFQASFQKKKKGKKTRKKVWIEVRVGFPSRQPERRHAAVLRASGC